MPDKCPVCRKGFASEEEKKKSVTANDRYFHVECFNCHSCKRSLINDFFMEEARFVEEDAPDMLIPLRVEFADLSCMACVEKHETKECSGCKRRCAITDTTLVTANLKWWHRNCLVCSNCRDPITEYVIVGGKRLCCKPSCGLKNGPNPPVKDSGANSRK